MLITIHNFIFTDNPMRLSGTKVVMTSGGFVQVRSDRGKPPVVSTTLPLTNGKQVSAGNLLICMLIGITLLSTFIG